MKTKVLQVFYNENGLPFKDQERTVHFPVIGSGFMGASNTTQIRFYFKEIGDDAVKYVAVSKLPNGKVGSKVLENYYDSELDEPYALLELDSYYTQYKGDLFISLQGYQGGVQVTYDEDTELYEIEGTPTIQATGSIKFTNNYATQFVGSGEEQNITLQQLLAIISDTVLRYYVNSSNTLAEVFNEIGTKICAVDIEGDEYLVEMSGDTNIVIYDIHNQEWYAFTGANTTTIDSVLQDSNKQIIATQNDLSNKLDKKTTINTVYSVNGNAEQTQIPFSTSVLYNALVQRDSAGQVAVPQTPTANNHATSKKYVDDAISALGIVYSYKGTKTVAQLNALTGQVAGDVYNVSDSGTIGSIQVIAGDNVAWDGTQWDKLAGTLDLSGYVLKSLTIAGIDLQDNISAQELTNALVYADNSEIDSLF